jgi:hypothetical protein
MLGQSPDYLTDPMGNPIPGEDDEPTIITVPGVSAPGPLSLDYYRNKLAEFQQMMLALDQTASAARALQPLALEGATVNDDLARLYDDITTSLAEFDAKKASFRTAAEALNFAINGVNMVGANLAPLRIPQGLGVVPAAAAAAIAGGLAVAAALIVWGRDWIAGMNERAKILTVAGAITDPAKRDAALSEAMKIEAASQATQESPLANVANIVKWVAGAAVVYFAFQAFDKARKA